MIHPIVTGIVTCFLVLGGADYLTGSRLGLGGEFERGMLAAALLLCRQAVAALLSGLGKAILALSTIGLVLACVQRLTGRVILPGMGSLDEVFMIVGGICVFLAGIFPFLAAVQHILANPLQAAGNRLSINDTSVGGLLLALANGIPVTSLLGEMDSKGRMLNTAFLVSASCIFGDHLAYTSQVAPELTFGVMAGKLGVSTHGLSASGRRRKFHGPRPGRIVLRLF